MEVCQYEFPEFWERDPQTDGHSRHRKGSLGTRRHLFFSLFLQGKIKLIIIQENYTYSYKLYNFSEYTLYCASLVYYST